MSVSRENADSFLLQGKHLLDFIDVACGHQTVVGEVALLLFGLLGQDVALERMFSLDFS